MDAFGNLRPCNFGPRKEPGESLSYAEDVDQYTREQIERVTRLAGYLAIQHNPPLPVWSLDKANVLAATSRLWRSVVSQTLEKEFPKIKFGHHLIDSAATLMIKRPTALNGVVLTSNLFGEIVSDEASVIPGSLGLLPRASLCSIPSSDSDGRVKGIYEPVHGSAPDIVSMNLVNPIGTILSATMMLRYSLALPLKADTIEGTALGALNSGVRTANIGGTSSTTQMSDAIIGELEKLLQSGK
ncbi:isopropyl malate dehydrogenase [Bisporella sp. PMI_857]|nr:isopropyl malate dehydrogenase [Bisporella sp. PMI_857]